MRNIKRTFSIILIFIFSISFAFSQQKSTDKITIDGISYFLHKVKKRESLYAIAKLYGVEIMDIKKANPKIKAKLRRGKTLKIPILDTNFIYHKITKGQTIYSVAKLYNVTEEDIIVNNPNIKNGLGEGNLLKIPKKNAQNSDNIIFEEDNKDNPGDINSVIDYVDNPCEQFKYEGQAFKVALLLPLYLKDNANMRIIGSEEEKRIKFFYNSKIFIEYYEGTLLALDSLRKLGISIDLQVYDTENNTQKVKEIASLPEIAEMDLIIGPVYAKNISIVADKIAGQNINIISPLDSKDSIIHSVSNLFQVNASSGMRINKMADYINKIDNKNIIIVHTKTSKEKKLIEILEQKLSRNGDTTSSLKTLFFKKNSEIYKLQSLLSRESANIIIVPSDDEVVVTNLMSKLSPLSEKFSLTVFGSRRWETFSNMDFEYYSLLNIHYHANTYIDDFSEEMFNFENKFKNVFEYKPSDYAIHGFDIMFYFANVMKNYGKHFNLCINNDKMKQKGLHTDFNFKKTSENGGFENNTVYLIKYNDDYYARLVDTTKDVIYIFEED